MTDTDTTPLPIPQEALLASPCIRVCCLDDADVCLGCFRSLEEIRNWQASDNASRAIVMQQSAERREAHDQLFPSPSTRPA